MKYFSVKVKKNHDNGIINVSEESFVSLLILEGEGSLEYKEDNISFKKGDCIFIPSKNARVKIYGDSEFIEVRI